MGGSNSKIDEVLSNVRLDTGKLSKEDAKAIWDEFDTDKSGTLNAEETKNFINRYCAAKEITDEKTVADIQASFVALLDTNGDGVLSFDELTDSKDEKAQDELKAQADEFQSSKVVAQVNEPDTEFNKYKTYDDSFGLGAEFPDISNVDWKLNTRGDYAAPAVGKPFVILLWGQFNKAGYKYMPLYSKLQEQYPQVTVAGLSIDTERDLPEKFVEDPKNKYITKFETNFCIGFDEKKTVKKGVEQMLRRTPTNPLAFIVDKDGKVFWFQDHSQIGATVPTYMDQVTRQVGLMLQGDEAEKNGPNPQESESESDEDDSEDGGNMAMMTAF